MDNSYRMNCMNSSCRRNGFQNRQMSRPSCDCGKEENDMYQHLSHLPLAMGYVPAQHFQNTFDTCRGLQMGTLFPELCKPFCGKGGGCRC